MIWSWVKVLQAILGFANYVAEIVRDRQLLGAGEAKHLAKDLALLQKNLGIADRVSDEVELLTEQELNNELRT